MSTAVAAPPKPKPAPPPDYKMPTVKVGADVWYYDDYDSPVPRAAKVTLTNEDTVNLSIFCDGSTSLLTKNGCRHVSDPNRALVVRVIAEGDGGLWDYMQKSDAQSNGNLERALMDLQVRVDKLEQAKK